MASDMLGGFLHIRDHPCPESAWGEKAYAYVVLHSNQCVCFTYFESSLSHSGGAIVCHRPNLPIRY